MMRAAALLRLRLASLVRRFRPETFGTGRRTRRGVLVVVGAAGATATLATFAQANEEDEMPDPLPNVKPFVALFLDDDSRARLRERWPQTDGARSADYVLLEPTHVTSDVTRPDMYAPLMGEPATAKITRECLRSNGVSTLRAEVTVSGTKVEGIGGCVPSISWGEASDDDIAHVGAREGDDCFKLLSFPQLELGGTICRAEYWHESKCHLKPLLECPLCTYMKQSPCREPFIAWEDCVNACEARGGTDDERQARFIAECATQTLALKECVDKYPEFFGAMFGGGGGGGGSSPADDAEATGDHPASAHTDEHPQATPPAEGAAAR